MTIVYAIHTVRHPEEPSRGVSKDARPLCKGLPDKIDRTVQKTLPAEAPSSAGRLVQDMVGIGGLSHVGGLIIVAGG